MQVPEYDFNELWDYSKPGETRAKFEERLTQSHDSYYILELQTQIARTYSLEQQFEKAHAILDEVEKKITPDTPRLQVRYLLERGRTFNSAKQKAQALSLFIQAHEAAEQADLEFYAVDAIHMVALASDSLEERRLWTERGIAAAEKSTEARTRKWLGAFYNNLGWDYHDAGSFQSALENFEKALLFYSQNGTTRNRQIAQWTVARALRSLGRIDDALKIQIGLSTELNELKVSDGYVDEELGELYLIKN